MSHARMQGWALLVVTLGLVLAAPASAASRVPCGQPATQGGDATVAELSPNTTRGDDPALDSFGEKTKKRDVEFIFDVTGCTLASDAVKVSVGGDEHDAVTFSPPVVKADVIRLDGIVDPTRFDPGTHKPVVTLASNTSGLMKTQSFKVTLERKEPPTWPTAWSVVALVVGFGVAVALAIQAARGAYDKQLAENQPTAGPGTAKGKVDYNQLAIVAAVVGAVGGGYVAWKTGYNDSDKWSPGPGSYFALLAAVGAASAGGAAPGLAKAITAKPVPKPPGPPTPPQPA